MHNVILSPWWFSNECYQSTVIHFIIWWHMLNFAAQNNHREHFIILSCRNMALKLIFWRLGLPSYYNILGWPFRLLEMAFECNGEALLRYFHPFWRMSLWAQGTGTSPPNLLNESTEKAQVSQEADPHMCGAGGIAQKTEIPAMLAFRSRLRQGI